MDPFDALLIYRARLRPDGDLEAVYRKADVECVWKTYKALIDQRLIDRRHEQEIEIAGSKRYSPLRKVIG